MKIWKRYAENSHATKEQALIKWGIRISIVSMIFYIIIQSAPFDSFLVLGFALIIAGIIKKTAMSKNRKHHALSHTKRETHANPIIRKPAMSKAQAQMSAHIWIKQAHESTKLINETTNPDVFFSRYDFLIEVTMKLVAAKRWIKFYGTSPSTQLNILIETRPQATHDFINRYNEKVTTRILSLKSKAAKVNNANKFLDTLTDYSEKIDNDNVVYYSQLHQELLELAEDE